MTSPKPIVIINLRPDIVVWSDQGKELTVPWDENMELAHENRMSKYDAFHMEIEMKGGDCLLRWDSGNMHPEP